ncbi:family 1 encapsulin nanocompartment shell protein [Minwuia sp.]|uniref:family 1 encapsulin nanocompartment shell protein n=1 Tax=Minwuia sp. TaxID=2493630 RepID=UPI003A91964A
MDDLKRGLAPVSKNAWTEIEEAAATTLKTVLAARQVVDFKGPLGYHHDAVATGRVRQIDEPLADDVSARQRVVLPMVELRVPFEIEIDELENLDRGAEDADLDPVVAAARTIALAEDRLVFQGYEAAGIHGVMTSVASSAGDLPDDPAKLPESIAEALEKLRLEGVQGPFAMVLPVDLYIRLQAAVSDTGRRVLDHARHLLDGPVVPSRAVEGGLILSRRGGDFELYVGRDFAIGYSSHDARHVKLYLEETLSFRAIGDEAAIALPLAKS